MYAKYQIKEKEKAMAQQALLDQQQNPEVDSSSILLPQSMQTLDIGLVSMHVLYACSTLE